MNQLIKNKENNLKIYFLESGQADSILIKTPEKQNIIIDLGSQIGLKKLNQKIPWWDKKINLLIITHPHDDHIAGIPLLLEKYKIEKIIFTGIECETPLYQEILKQIKNKKIDLLIPQEKQKIILGKKCELNFLYPQESLNKKTIENLNNSSIINQLKCNGIISLFMGDAEEIVEKKILEKNYNLKSDILKIGHHGSISSSHQEFLEKVKPKISIIMVGEKNKFNHPHLRTIKKLQKIGSLIFRTDLNGTITVKVEEGKIGYQIEKSTQQIIY
ncbi:MAG: MBL fold metallo-hydrolase [Patescibacteria group bacterium]